MRFFAKTLDKLKGALRKTAEVLNTDVRTLFVPGRGIDDAFLAEMEEKFIQADMGVKNQKCRGCPAYREGANDRRLGRPAGARTEIRPRRSDRDPRRRHQRRRQ